MRFCVADGYIVSPPAGLSSKGSIWIEDGRIVCLETEQGTFGRQPDWASVPSDDSGEGQGTDGGYERIDAAGKLVTPGLIDLHVHFREPGFEYKEDIRSGCEAAARGGFTAVCPMPNTKPVIDDGELVGYILQQSARACGVRVLPVGAVTKGQQGLCLAELSAMKEAGAAAFSEDGKSVMDAELMKQAMIKAAALGLPILDHAEDAARPGEMAAEEMIVERDIELAKETGCRLHLCHISTEGSLELIRRAKAEGIAVTAETAPHYFTLDQSQVKGRADWKMNPPLRGESHTAAIAEALADGTLDAIATDHAPHSREEKALPFDEAPNGIIGLETSFPVSYTALVRTGRLTLTRLVEVMSTDPARIIGIDGGLVPGGPADLAVFDLEEPYVIDAGEFASKAENCPFAGMEVYGRTVLTMVGGEVIYRAFESKRG